MKIKILAILIVLFFCQIFYAQVSTQWIARFNGPSTNNDAATCIAVDNAGNVYVGGYSVSAANQEDYLTIKYSPTGEEVWVARYNGSGSGKDVITAIATDNNGNTYVTGSSEGKESGFDYVTIKYNNKGEEEWVARFNGTESTNDGANALLVDKDGSVYVTGYSNNKETSIDIVTIKYTSTGDVAWLNKFDNPRHSVDYGTCLTLDESGYVYVGGYSETESAGHDFAILKISSAGNSVWNQHFNGSGSKDDEIKAIALDAAGNIYVTGSSVSFRTGMDIVTLKYSMKGELQWQANYNGPGGNIDEPSAMLVDKYGTVYVTGSSLGNGTNFDYCTIKYNTEGVELWSARFNDQGNGADQATCIALDELGSIYVSGFVWNGTDNDFATIKYNPLGTELWVAKYNGPGNSLDKATAIAVDNKGNVYVTGYGIGTATQNDFSTIKYIQSPPENAPNLVSPAYGSSGIGQTPTLEWNAMRNADFFRLQIATDKNFTSMIMDTNIYISSEQYKVPENKLSNNTQYYWRIGATNAAGTGPWSASWLFSVLNAPDSPELMSPANGAAGQPLSPTLQWQKVSTAETYRLQIAKDYRFTEMIQDVTGLTTNEYTPPGGVLNNNSVYFWRVNATNVGGTVPWSNVWSLGIGSVNPPQSPVQITLPDGALGQSLTPSLDWNDVPSVATYRIQISADLNFRVIVVDEDNLSSSNYTVPAGKLMNNKMYYWRICATNLGGTSNWSLIWTFSTMVSGLQRVGADVPKELKVYDNSPEPFSSMTSIRFDIPSNFNNTKVSVIVYDLSGKEVTKIIDEKVKAGSWIVNWDGSNYPRGYYLYQLHAEGFVETKKMLLVK